jgi:MoaA/NifB/PqqE/SkfB family radical SAM enzyme
MEHYEILGLDLGLENNQVVGQVTGELKKELSLFFPLFLTELNRNKVLASKNGSNIYSLFLPPLPSKPGTRELIRKIMNKFFHRRIPSTLTFAVTYRCQATCIHCSSEQHKSPLKEELSTIECKQVIDQALDLGAINIVFTGGEPLLRKDIFELINYVDKDRAICNMFTNGQYLTTENIEKLRESGIYAILVSLDSPDPETHDDWRRIPDLFEMATSGIKRALKTGILTGISTYVSRDGLAKGDHKKMMELGKQLGVHEVIFFDTLPAGRFHNNYEGFLTMEDKEVIRDFTNNYLYNAEYPGIIAQSWINHPKGSGCFAANEQFYVTAYGDVCPCDFTPLSFGDIRHAPLKDIWDKMINHEEYREKRTHCRLQDSIFRDKYLSAIPSGVSLPYHLA